MEENDDNIFLLETMGEGVLNHRQLCTVESLAKWNPNSNVTVHFSLILEPSKSLRSNKSQDFLKKQYSNIHFDYFKPHELIKGSKVEKLYKRVENHFDLVNIGISLLIAISTYYRVLLKNPY